mgnify:CR=1 FL=1
MKGWMCNSMALLASSACRYSVAVCYAPVDLEGCYADNDDKTTLVYCLYTFADALRNPHGEHLFGTRITLARSALNPVPVHAAVCMLALSTFALSHFLCPRSSIRAHLPRCWRGPCSLQPAQPHRAHRPQDLLRLPWGAAQHQHGRRVRGRGGARTPGINRYVLVCVACGAWSAYDKGGAYGASAMHCGPAGHLPDLHPSLRL